MHTVETTQLTLKARSVIDAYLYMSFTKPISCPYFNNRRKKTRGNLRVLIGKGLPKEIIEEAHIVSKLSRIDIDTLSPEKLKEFLVIHNLGIDCSGFAYHVLDAVSKEKTGKPLTSSVTSLRKGFIGSLLARLRPAENIGVNSFHHEKNSSKISVREIKPGDIITFIGTGKDKNYNHILVVTKIEKTMQGKTDTVAHTTIHYAHSYMWPQDGLYNHGVREGIIDVSGDDILSGTWTEQGVTGNENYTYTSAQNAQEVSIRRLRFNI